MLMRMIQKNFFEQTVINEISAYKSYQHKTETLTLYGFFLILYSVFSKCSNRFILKKRVYSDNDNPFRDDFDKREKILTLKYLSNILDTSKIRDSGFGYIDEQGFEHYSSEHVMCNLNCSAKNYVDSMAISFTEIDDPKDLFRSNGAFDWVPNPKRRNFLEFLTARVSNYKHLLKFHHLITTFLIILIPKYNVFVW